MSETLQITCINKNPREDRYHSITHVGGGGLMRWKYTLDEAIRMIESGTHKFYTHVGGHSRWVIVASRNGRKYLKTEADHDTPDNLLSLPEC